MSGRDAAPSPARARWRQWLQAEWLLLLFGGLALGLAALDPQPWASYRRWLQLPTLAGLLGLLVATQGICDSGVVQRAAATLAARAHSVRTLGLLLAAVAALLSMLLTNDVSLFLIVPLTVALGGISNLPVLRMAVLEALAVNAGSSLSPIGNPQNLLLWQHARLPFLHFVAAMLPVAALMMLLLGALTWCWLPSSRIHLERPGINGISTRLALLSAATLAMMVWMMEVGRAECAAPLVLLPYAVFARRTLARVDWWLLATFAAIFLGLGQLAELAPVRGALDRLDFSQPLVLYASGIVASQLISNVPATVLLLDRARDPLALAIAVNVGGFGLAIGSLANLIALRLARQPHGLRELHRVSIPFLLVCAPLVYLAWRWIGP
ncbi:MAG: citrate transporter [Pseudomonadota bacterium]|jgi:Na+/H+ antiporter NhaD/arsenite permease-like protein|nr:citrate transporter [Xanthomonadaceae bacterium]MDE2248339.1 citrate transporter [Xanthomonadaceae bacterium]MDE3211470.1 citrate transporter [Pseudomonadota bacterium]